MRALREARGWSLREAARRADVGASTLSGWESGRARPVADVLGRYLDALQVDDEDRAGLMASMARTADGEAAPPPCAPVLVALRARDGRSLRELGQATGLRPSTLSRWERGEAEPNPERLSRLLDALAVAPEVRDALLGLARRAPSAFVGSALPDDPDGSAKFHHADALFEPTLAGIEAEVRLRALRDPRWWDWQARFQAEAIIAFLAHRSFEAGYRWAAASLRSCPFPGRHPRIEDALAVFREVCAPEGEVLGSARRLRGRRYREWPELNADWGMWTEAAKVGAAGDRAEARRLLAETVKRFPVEDIPGEGERFRHRMFLAQGLLAADDPGGALDLVEANLDLAHRMSGWNGYDMLWAGRLQVLAAVSLRSREAAIREVEEYRARCVAAGARGDGWWRHLLRLLPPDLRRQAAP